MFPFGEDVMCQVSLLSRCSPRYLTWSSQGNKFTPHNLCEENHERQVEARVQALLEVVDSDPPERIRPCDLQKLTKFL
jgi:hypothetical protein